MLSWYNLVANKKHTESSDIIARFQNEKLIPVIDDLFYQFIDKLIEMGEISNKYSFVWAKAVEKNLAKLELKIEALTKHMKEKYFLKDDVGFEDCLQYLMHLASLKKIEFLYGKGNRKTQLQKDIDCMVEIGDKRHSYLENLKIAGKRKSFSKTDKDATL